MTDLLELVVVYLGRYVGAEPVLVEDHVGPRVSRIHCASLVSHALSWGRRQSRALCWDSNIIGNVGTVMRP